MVPLKLEMEPFPVLVRTSALNTGLFPKLTAFTSPLTCCVLVREIQKKRDGDEDVM